MTQPSATDPNENSPEEAMRTAHSPRLKRVSWAKMSCIVFLFCAAIASPAQTLNTLVSFNLTNGADVWGPVVQGTDGNFYGTTELGGANNSSPCSYAGCGTVFTLTPSGAD